MLDPSRLTERWTFYRDLIPDLAAWGYNTVLLHLFDDEGSAISLEHPRMLPTSGALPAAKWRELVERADDHGIQVIPEVECLGHAGFLTRLPEHRHLLEPPPGGGPFWSICPLHPETLTLLGDVLEQIAEIFPSSYIHLGMDETDIGGGARTGAALQKQEVWELFSEHTCRLNTMVKKLGRRAMMWGDHLLHSPELTRALPKDLVICHWLYGLGHGTDYEPTTRRLLDAGFEVIGCPSSCCTGTVFLPHRHTIENVRDFDQACRRIGDPRLLGMINTLWSPYRHLPAMVFPIAAYAGGLFSGDDTGFEESLEALAATRFGVDATVARSIARVLSKLHLGRQRDWVEHSLLGSPIHDPIDETAAIASLERISSEAISVLEQAHGSVTRGGEEYTQWIVTAKMMLATARQEWNPAAENFIQSWFAHRDSTAMVSDEPAMGQTDLFRANRDNLFEVLVRRAPRAG